MGKRATVEAVGVARESDARVVLLSVGDAVVPILVSPDQAHAIEVARSGTPFDRPLTHDVLVDVVAELGGAIDSVRIDELRDETFYAKLDAERYHDGERTPAVFDVRASDAIAIGLRADCPILVSDHVVDRAGRAPEEFPLD
jgi:bifunctional DNase/RNase